MTMSTPNPEDAATGLSRPAKTPHSPQIYLVGSGIASLAAAAFMIRDGDIAGHNITIFEALDRVGGSLDGAGSPRTGYVLRGGRMLESKYLCTYALFSSIPTLDERQTVTQEILAWNETMKTGSKSRLVHDGERQVAPKFDLSEKHILTIERLAVEPEHMLGKTTISDQFDDAFFRTNFWAMWCTTFAFQPWHSAVEFKRYLVRFSHMVSGFSRLEGIMRTVYNQYDSMVRPLEKWLKAHGVRFELNTRVTDLTFVEHAGRTAISNIETRHGGVTGNIPVHTQDQVLVTLGSMTECSSLGSMDEPAVLLEKETGGSWALWQKIAKGRPEFGNPSTFCEHVQESKWVSFTVTMNNSALLHFVRDFTGNVPGEGGLITFPESSWLMSIVIPHQPHFIGQPDNVSVLWGYGLSVDRPGDFAGKPMSECTGREIMVELLGHLKLKAGAEKILATSVCIPCMMPFITSQFLPREQGDRPNIIPESSMNFAFIGQYCELKDDVVFTVEYSIRSAQTAVYALLGLNRRPPEVYKGEFDPRVLYRAFMALHDLAG